MMLTVAFSYEYYVTKAPVNSGNTLAQEMLYWTLAQVLNIVILYVAYYIGKRSSLSANGTYQARTSSAVGV